MTQALITVVVPVRDRIGTIDRCFRSIFAQGVDGLRVVAVDNGSADGSRARLDELAAEGATAGVPMTVIDESKRGAAAARNAGIAQVFTPWVMHFDSDDYMLPGHVMRITAAIAANPEADIIGFPSYEEDGRGRRVVRRFVPDMVAQLHHSVLSTEQYAVRTELLRAAGGWDESLRAWDDLELGVRLMLAANRVVALPGAPTLVSDISTRTAGSITGSSYAAGVGRWEAALDKIEARLAKTPWAIHARGIRAKLAALYAREGCSDLARRQLQAALSGLSRKQRTVITAAYQTLRLTGHGASLLMTRLL
ncbi:MAG: glycosyltransferase family 2 protein [Candidatus Amulumruptor caecigallinarius]|nr:glycosyltransferase family 2 protein [Candidatus Amulumruptor caecigallinarius]MCM1396682.1 glycosyltransferase family 2 protein [Candidatus Amulumruptor caecigallinarius]MCM1453260.1 glycosyltransferase family 2 protein [bacterium]